MRLAVLILVCALTWQTPVRAQEHCISPDAIRDHAGDAVIGDYKRPDRELIAIAAPGETVMVLVFHRGNECEPDMARMPARLFGDFAAFIGGQPA